MIKKLLIPFLLFFLYFIVGLWTLADYGQNWDEPTHFYRGETYLNYFLTGSKNAQNLPPFKPYFQKDDTVFFAPIGVNKSDVPSTSQMQGTNLALWDRGDGHPPLSDIFSASFNYILFQKLRLINDIDSFHVYSLFLAAILVGVIFWWTAKYYGRFAGFIAALSLSLYPLFLGESHFNIKDPPETVFYSLTLITFYEGIVRRKNKWIILSSVLLGFAFGTKFNIVFIPFTLIPWIFIYLFSRRDKLKKYLSIFPSAIIYPVIPFVILIAFWPFLWQSPFKNLLETINYYTTIGNNSSFDSRFISVFGINTYAIQWVLFTAPLITLFLSAVGITFAFFKSSKEKNKTLFFILLWFIIPIARVTRPDAGIYGGVRHIMEYIPPMAILAGIGAFFLREEISKKIRFSTRSKKILLSLIFILMFIPITIKLISIHPNEGVYFNPLIGGMKGASAHLVDWGDSLGNPYKQGIRWINRNSEPNAKLTTAFGLMTDIPSTFIRRDILFSTTYKSGPLKKGEYIIGLTHDSGLEDRPFIYYINNSLNPLYEVRVDDVAILKIWKNDLAHTKEGYGNIVEVKGTGAPLITDDSFQIDLNREVNLYGVEIEYNDGNCQLPDANGYFLLSKDGSSWDRPPGDFTSIPGVSGISDPLSKNKISYWFSGRKAKYIGADFGTDNSCLKNITSVKVTELTR